MEDHTYVSEAHFDSSPLPSDALDFPLHFYTDDGCTEEGMILLPILGITLSKKLSSNSGWMENWFWKPCRRVRMGLSLNIQPSSVKWTICEEQKKLISQFSLMLSIIFLTVAEAFVLV